MDKSWPVALRIVGLLFVLVGAIWLIKNIAWVISLLIASTLIVYALHPILVYLKERCSIPHGGAVVIVFLVFLMVCLLGISLLIPIISYEFFEIANDISANYPLYASNIQRSFEWLTAQLLHLDLEDQFNDMLTGFSQRLEQVIKYIIEATLSLAMGLIDLFFVFFMVLFLLSDFENIRTQLVELFPVKRREFARKFICIVDRNVGSFFRGSLLRCLVVGLVTGLTLYIIGMPYALLLGILAGLFNFILYIGPFIAAIPAILISFSAHTPAPWLVLLVYVIIQFLDGTLLAPYLLGRMVRLKPITIFISILAGGRLGGILGMLVAVPLAGIIKGLLGLLKEYPAYIEPVEKG